MYRFSNVDLIDTMTRLTESLVAHYQSDLNYDIEALEKIREDKKPSKDDLHYIWIARECGTNLLHENRIYHRGSYEQSCYLIHLNAEKYFIIDITDVKSLRGNVYGLDNNDYYGDLSKEDYCADLIDVEFVSGHKQIYPLEKYEGYRSRLMYSHGAIAKTSVVFSKEIQALLDEHLHILRKQREEDTREGNLDKFIRTMERDKARTGDR